MGLRKKKRGERARRRVWRSKSSGTEQHSYLHTKSDNCCRRRIVHKLRKQKTRGCIVGLCRRILMRARTQCATERSCRAVMSMMAMRVTVSVGLLTRLLRATSEGTMSGGLTACRAELSSERYRATHERRLTEKRAQQNAYERRRAKRAVARQHRISHRKLSLYKRCRCAGQATGALLILFQE
jgi:hypothetical protein